MKAAVADQEMRHKEMLNAVQLAISTHTENMRTAQDKQKFIQGTIQNNVAHRQKLAHQEAAAAVKRKQTSKGK